MPVSAYRTIDQSFWQGHLVSEIIKYVYFLNSFQDNPSDVYNEKMDQNLNEFVSKCYPENTYFVDLSQVQKGNVGKRIDEKGILLWETINMTDHFFPSLYN